MKIPVRMWRSWSGATHSIGWIFVFSFWVARRPKAELLDSTLDCEWLWFSWMSYIKPPSPPQIAPKSLRRAPELLVQNTLHLPPTGMRYGLIGYCLPRALFIYLFVFRFLTLNMNLPCVLLQTELNGTFPGGCGMNAFQMQISWFYSSSLKKLCSH